MINKRSEEASKSQRQTFIALIIVCIFFILAFSYLLFDNKQQVNSLSPHVGSTDLPSDKTSPQEMWMSRMEAGNSVIDQKLNYLEKVVLQSKKDQEKVDIENQILKEEVNRLKQELKENKIQKLALAKEELALADNKIAENSFFQERSNFNHFPVMKAPLGEVTISQSSEKIFNVNQVIPSGTTVRALLVSSVDAPCNIYSPSDPQPIKLRILDDAHLPKKVRARLKGGLVIASAYGDLSSERINVRIERLTQIKANGDFIETEVTGFVSGEDGKYGIRGCVVDKSSKIIGNAAMSGFFSGASQYLQAIVRSKYCGFGGFCGPCDNGPTCLPYGSDVAKEGASQGVSSGLDLLTDYYIKRAEQVRPVIQVTAGRIVDITFTHNAELGDLYVKDKVKRIREVSRAKR